MRQCCPFLPDFTDQRCDIGGIHFKGSEPRTFLQHEHERTNLVVKGLKIKILYKTYNMVSSWHPRVIKYI